jgi:anti-sigma regulatory factor (Ser/Thr protein kinase)
VSRRVLSLVFSAEPGTAALVGPAIRGIAEAVGFERARAVEVALCAQEAAVNSAEHAFAGQPDGIVSVLVAVVDDRLEVSVRDRGRPMPPALLDEARVKEPDPLSERGRGLFMITRLSESVRYGSDTEGNVLEMTFRLPVAAG